MRLPDLGAIYGGLRPYECGRCGHGYLARASEQRGCPACRAPIDMQVRGREVDWSNEGQDQTGVAEEWS
jgi:hypothetical protein